MNDNANKDTVLVVDDIDVNLKVVGNLLEKNNYEVIFSKSGKEALSILEANQPDVILLDIMMPEMDGYETCKRIKKNFKSKNIPVIFLTAKSDTVDIVEGFNIGGSDFISKPLKKEELLVRIRTQIELKKSREFFLTYQLKLEDELQKRSADLIEANKSLTKEIENRKIYEKELVVAKEQAEIADRLKTEFLAQMSHEIRTPLNGILSFSSLLEDELKIHLTNEHTQFFSFIKQNGNRLLRTLSQIILYSQIQTGNCELDIKKLNLIEDILKNIIEEYKDKKINNNEIILNKKSKNGSVKSDEYLLEIILRNVLDNSVKFTENGKVTVNVENEDEEFLNIMFEDNGIGMTKDYLERIFDPFTQEDEGFDRAYEGNGLGMAVVKKCCELLDIEILVDSIKNKGTKLELKIRKN